MLIEGDHAGVAGKRNPYEYKRNEPDKIFPRKTIQQKIIKAPPRDRKDKEKKALDPVK